MSDMGFSNPYSSALGSFPEGLFSLVQNGQYPSIAGGQSSGFDGSYQMNPAQLQSLLGMGQSMMQQSQQQNQQGKGQMMPPMAPPAMPYTPIALRGLLPSTQMPFNYQGGSR